MKHTAILTALFLTGCFQFPSGVYEHGTAAIADESIMAQIVEGETTRAEVRALLGPPVSSDITDGGLEKWVYTYGVFHAGVVKDPTKSHTLVISFAGDFVKFKGRGEL